MMKRLSFLLLLVLLFQCSTTLAQPAAAPAPPVIAPAAPATPALGPAPPVLGPAPAGPTDITKVLKKASQFTVLLKLMRATSVDKQINAQLNNSNNGLTIFAPNDNAFSSLKSGTLNQLSSEQQVELVQFHVVPTYLAVPQFQTVSNPLRTQAGGSGKFEFPLTLTTSGSSVNISTGVTNATVDQTVYNDGQLAVYMVDKVLLPMSIFGPKPPAPAPAPAKPKKKPALASSPVADSVPVDTSGEGKLMVPGMMVFIGLSVVGTFYS
ncbi:fasciclin-like arabinogalactan protein 12 precursor [Eucalyptus grandis]|nr:fasciclin-like arabinogalactan protein 12 precursor [Eucalyptus grandis]ABS50662.1 fasciclin-like arabinogalactan protein [Eucalyptus grandis]